MFARLRELFARSGRVKAAEFKMICGLGNPGPRYAHTRHNAGYQVVAGLARAYGGKWSKFHSLAQVCTVEIGGCPVLLLQPLTYMNSSGLAVRPVMRKWSVPPASLLVISDDLDLPFGSIRLRPGGSAGGHRGIQSIIDSLGTQHFPRLRIGIGRPPEGVDPASYVLSPFPQDDRERLAEILEDAAAAAACWVTDGIDAAMNRYNRSA